MKSFLRASWLTFALLIAAHAADVSGIWTGQVTGRLGQLEDVSFLFKEAAGKLTGTLYGDEFDLAVEQGSVSGSEIKFIVTTTNYYSGKKIQFSYQGTISADEIELSRERILGPGDKRAEGEAPKQVIKLKRLTT